MRTCRNYLLPLAYGCVPRPGNDIMDEKALEAQLSDDQLAQLREWEKMHKEGKVPGQNRSKGARNAIRAGGINDLMRADPDDEAEKKKQLQQFNAEKKSLEEENSQAGSSPAAPVRAGSTPTLTLPDGQKVRRALCSVM
jgi:hypothetical protein